MQQIFNIPLDDFQSNLPSIGIFLIDRHTHMRHLEYIYIIIFYCYTIEWLITMCAGRKYCNGFNLANDRNYGIYRTQPTEVCCAYFGVFSIYILIEAKSIVL